MHSTLKHKTLQLNLEPQHNPLARLPASIQLGFRGFHPHLRSISCQDHCFWPQVFENTGALEADWRVLTPLAVSKAVTGATLVAGDAFYTGLLGANRVLLSASDEDQSSVVAFQLPGAHVLVRLVSRPDSPTSFSPNDADGPGGGEEEIGSVVGGGAGETDTEAAEGLVGGESMGGRKLLVGLADTPSRKTIAGSLTVSDVEEVKRRVRLAFREDRFCGVDKFYDNHFAWDQFTVSFTDSSIQ